MRELDRGREEEGEIVRESDSERERDTHTSRKIERGSDTGRQERERDSEQRYVGGRARAAACRWTG